MEKSQEFYREQRAKIKRKLSLRERMPVMQLSTLKAYTKQGFLYEFTRDTPKALHQFKQSYSLLCQLLPMIKKSFDVWEIKAFADCLMLKYAKACFAVNEAKQAISLFCIHYSAFKQSSGELLPKTEYMARCHHNNLA